MNEIYLYGDSAAQGIVMDEEGRYRVSRVGCVRLLKRGGYPIRNYAMHGYTVRQGLESFRNTKTDPGGMCVIEFGGNDCDLDWDAVAKEPEAFHDGKVPIGEFRDLLRQFVLEAKERELEPVLVTPHPLISGRFFRWVSRGRDEMKILAYLRNDTESISRWQERYANAVRQVAGECSCRVADLRTWLLEELDYPKLICADGIHPNEAGQQLVARRAAECFPAVCAV